MKKNSKWYFWFFLLITSLCYNYQKIIFLRPGSTHQWRQADCLSIALNFYQEGMNFFSPSIHWVGEKGDGKTVSEFPIIYYLVALLWKIFGYHEFIFRGVNILIVFCGLFALFRIMEDVLKDSLWAIMLTLFLFTSPLLAYYANNFLADCSALGLSLVGWYFFYSFYKKESGKYFIVSIFFFLLAGLIKISSAISFATIILIFLFEYLHVIKFKEEKKIFQKPVLPIVCFILVGLLFASWFTYAVHYNKINNSGIFLTDIFPMWELSGHDIRKNAILLYNELLPQFFSRTGLHFILILFLINVLAYKKANRLLITINISLFVGVIIYLVLFYKAFDMHDYYLTNLLIFLPITILTFFSALKKQYVNLFESKITKAAFAILLIFSIYNCAVQNRVKYSAGDKIAKYSFVLDNKEVDYWNWYHWWYDNHLGAYESITPYIRSLGIQPTDKVISIPDQSINITLYLMNQKGFTDFGYSGYATEDRIGKFISLGAKYLFINDTLLYEKDYIKPFLKNKIGSYRNIEIYDLRRL
jgi:hypothetical protein